MAFSYTSGNWTVSAQTTDHVSTAKNVPVVDLDYAYDFVKAKESDNEAVLINTTGASLVSPESIRFAKTPVNDVYSGSDIPASRRSQTKGGVRTLSEVKFNLKAVNSVSGEEVEIPMRGWICLQVPLASVITAAAVQYLQRRTVAASLDTGVVTETRVVSLARGDLSPL